MRLCFAPQESRITISETMARQIMTDGQTATLWDWAEDIAEILDSKPYGVVFQIGQLRWPEEPSCQLAVAIGELINAALIRRGAPEDMRVEVDKRQRNVVMDGYQHRTLLPHHDSLHSSYLTPSEDHEPMWRSEFRTFSEHGITTTTTHKMYQGFFIVEPGEACSITTFYDKVGMVTKAYSYTTGNQTPTLTEVAQWLGKNILALWEQRLEEQLRYLTLGATLGAQHPMFRLLPIHWAESGFTDAHIERFPELAQFCQPQKTAADPSPTERFLNALLLETLGMSWQEYRAEHELCISGERYDFLLSNNLTTIHGGLMGGANRYLEPICFVLGRPEGKAYNQWLAQGWQYRWPQN